MVWFNNPSPADGVPLMLTDCHPIDIELALAAVFLGNADKVAALLKIGANPNAKTTYDPPLLTAAIHGDPVMAALLLDAGADVNVRGSPAGLTALHWASATTVGKPAEVVKLLLERGADVATVADVTAWAIPGGKATPLQLAAHLGRRDIVREFVLDAIDHGIRAALEPARTNHGNALSNFLSSDLGLGGAAVKLAAHAVRIPIKSDSRGRDR